MQPFTLARQDDVVDRHRAAILAAAKAHNLRAYVPPDVWFGLAPDEVTAFMAAKGGGGG